MSHPNSSSKTQKPKALVAGGAGFLASHVCRALLDKGYEVVCVDNLCTGRRKNISELETDDAFQFVEADLTKSLPEEVTNQTYTHVLNLASPASPPKYVALALETLLVGSIGTKALLDLALRDGARFLQASTSEVYGEPEVHPQPEAYWGNVNSYGPRSMYDESKRYGEALIWVYRNQKDANTGIARIFNTYGPHMDPEDGRVVSNFIIQALQGHDITMHGDGKQTRSFCYVSDQVAGLVKLLESDQEGPINIGSPFEFTMLELAEKVIALTGSKSKIVYEEARPDDPTQRRADITKAKALLDWEPVVQLDEGLKPTIAYFRGELHQEV